MYTVKACSYQPNHLSPFKYNVAYNLEFAYLKYSILPEKQNQALCN